MSDDLTPFDFEGLSLRAMLRDGAPWFVAGDACRALDLANVSQAVSRLDDDERTLITGEGLPFAGITLVSESGLYSLILTSRKPEAKRFKRWVTRKVIPAIRKTGSYGAPNLDSVDGLLALSSQLTTKLIATTKRAEVAEAKVVELEPKAGAYDRFLDAEGLCGLQNAGRALNVGPNLFVAALRSAGIVTRQGRANVAYATYVDRGYFEHRPVTFWNHKIGADEQTLQAFFTARGLAWAEKLIASGKLVVRGVA